jgi:mannosyltransferase
VANMLGGPTVPLGLLLAVGAGVAAILKAPAPRMPGVALERPRHTLTWVIVVLPVATALVLWLANQASPAFATRYFAVLVGPILVLAAVGLSHAGKLGLVALAIVLALQFNPRTHELETKSNARTVAAEIRQSTYPGDLVVTIHPEQTPVLYYYLRDRGLRYADAISMVGDPGVFDWRDSLERLKAAKPTPTLRSYVSGMRPGQTLVLALPIIRGSNWSAPWTALVRKRSAQWARAADASEQLERIRIAPKFVNRRLLPRGLRVVFYRKVADAPASVTAATRRG